MTVFFTSDTHFGDPRVLTKDHRPFRTIPEHDEALVARWNGTVSPTDTVWHLGDFALHVSAERIGELLGNLRGKKHLVTGNNDGPDTLAAKGWASVQAYAELDVDDKHLVLCHYAFRTWKNNSKGWLDLHGHSHGRLSHLTHQYDVGVDVWDFRPVTLETILTMRRWGKTQR
ncbi:metallophosphoesterase family protein [Microvirga flavescens]|uniref:metallophosphoesterase family protein n=1 Tax=Microvirga flavescens TaxID=2249811 RepID=UPI000DD75AAC|nr:metallophosphoesterase family protein [Microvirga flavescens]